VILEGRGIDMRIECARCVDLFAGANGSEEVRQLKEYLFRQLEWTGKQRLVGRMAEGLRRESSGVSQGRWGWEALLAPEQYA